MKPGIYPRYQNTQVQEHPHLHLQRNSGVLNVDYAADAAI